MPVIFQLFFDRVFGRSGAPERLHCKKHKDFQWFSIDLRKIPRFPAGRLPRPAVRAEAAEAGNVHFTNGLPTFLNNRHLGFFRRAPWAWDAENIRIYNGFRAFPGSQLGVISFLTFAANGPSNISVFHVIWVSL